MLDTGNLVLATNTAIIVWQSFHLPTDTILPTQSLNQGDAIIARYSDGNYSSGKFQLAMQTDGNLVLYTVNTPQRSINSAYWATSTVGSGYQVEFNESGSVLLIAKNGTIMSHIFADNSSTEDFYQRAILEYDGVFRKYVYPKPSSPNSGSWPAAAWSIQSFIPSNICTSVTEDVGSGACGFNSLCQLGGDQRPNCTCPPGYIWVDPDDETLGCLPNFAPQLCSGAGSEASNQFHLVRMINADWPSSDYQHYTGVTEDWCRGQCLADCFCAVAIFKDGGDCWMKKTPLSNGRIDSSVGGKALVKIRNSNISTAPLQDGGGGPKKQDHHSTLIIVLGSSVCFLLLLVSSSIVVFLVKNKSSRAPEQQHQVLPGTSARVFSYEELVQATANFREKVGQGAFAMVYKGNLDPDNGSTDLVVAVKRVDNVVKESDKEFESEVSAIARTNHRNLVRLVGYCNEGQHRLLVYEFMNNGSVADVLFGDEEKPSWFTRMQIAVGTARGLYYLHEECSTQIIHCDIKPQNVLLDDSFTARISDFGLAKLLRVDQTRTTTGIRGTKGYVAPEWFRNLPVTVKVDVYSYGILLLELVCCRKRFQVTNVDENQIVLADWASDCYRQGSIDLLVENDEDARNDLRRVEKYVKVAIWCIQEEPSLRPPMKKVIQMLEGSIEVPVPPDPSSYISSI
ncbi:hypothetical protein Dimus_011682 [Dionaea muscipula]